MPKKIASTYQHRLFNDDELKLPAHDKIVRWADLEMRENVGLFLDRAGYKTTRNDDGETCVWGEQHSETISDTLGLDYKQQPLARAIRQIIKNKTPQLPPPPPVKVERVSWEEILKNERGTVVGAIDLLGFVKLPIALLTFSIDKARINWSVAKLLADEEYTSDQPYFVEARDLNLAETDFVTKFSVTDLTAADTIVLYGNELFSVSQVRWSFNGHEHEYKPLKLAVEAKASILTVGELIRQMKFYRGHLAGAKLFVVAPAEAWPADAQNILREQGIEPVNYRSNYY
jgi:hypothetical protein